MRGCAMADCNARRDDLVKHLSPCRRIFLAKSADIVRYRMK